MQEGHLLKYYKRGGGFIDCALESYSLYYDSIGLSTKILTKGKCDEP